MKHIQKILALILAICFIAIIPLSAFAAGEYDFYIVGNWDLQAIYDSEADDYRTVSADVSKLEINADGTGAFYIGDERYTAKWEYQANIENGYVYNFLVDYEDSELDLTLVYGTQDNLKGHAILFLSDDLYDYVRA